jgi:putative transposase
LSHSYPVKVVCRVLSVSRSGYYDYRRGVSHRRREADELISKKVEEIFIEHKRRYGARRIQAELVHQGKKVGLHKVRTLMKVKQLKAIQPLSFIPKTTVSPRGLMACTNLIMNKDSITEPNQAWVGDITYIPLRNGSYVYLASWEDMCSRQVKGWSLEPRMTDALVIKALERGLEQYRPQQGLIIHSDRGGQYFSHDFRKLLRNNKCRQSMAGVDNPYENAMAESFWSRLKAELLQDGVFETIEDARMEIFEYIDGYYNMQRRHSGIGYLTPNEFETQFYSS